MATPAEHEELYARLRLAILTRHFAAGPYARTNLYADGDNVLSDPADSWAIDDVGCRRPTAPI
jgi:hypothetical protein